MKNTVFIIQARLGSTRLPNKILLPFFKGKSLIEILIDKLKKFPIDVIVATSINPINDPLVFKLNQLGIKYFRGEEDDVLKRFIDAAKYYKIDRIVRVCSDNPFLDLASIQQIIDESNDNYDYVSFNVNGTPSIKTHFGFWTESVTVEALERVRYHTSDSLYREHVTNFIYSHPGLYSIKWIDVESLISKRNDIRLTIDTFQDFQIAQSLYAEIDEDASITEIVSYINNNKMVIDKMKEQIKLNSK